MLHSKIPKKSLAFIILLATISEREKEILIDRFYHKKTMEEVAQKFDITRPRVQQIENRLLTKIQKYFDFHFYD